MRKIAFILLALSSTANAELIHLFSYHNHPPFVTGTDAGQTYRLAQRLNAVAPPGIRFDVELLPRVRLNHRLRDWIAGNCPAPGCDDDWVVPWVNPNWGFVPAGKAPYLWLPQSTDANVIVSLAAKPIEYSGPKSLDGLVLAGIRGHRYVGIDERVKAGLIERVDGNVERDNLLMLLYGRVDAVLLPRSTVNYFLSSDPVLSTRASEFHLSAGYHQRYNRALMLPANREDLFLLLQKAGLSGP